MSQLKKTIKILQEQINKDDASTRECLQTIAVVLDMLAGDVDRLFNLIDKKGNSGGNNISAPYNKSWAGVDLAVQGSELNKANLIEIRKQLDAQDRVEAAFNLSSVLSEADIQKLMELDPNEIN